MSLQDKLDAFKADFVAGKAPYFAPADIHPIMARATAELIASDAAGRALKAGDKAPAFTLNDPDGKAVSSAALLAEGPPIRKPADCLAYPLLQDSDRADWPLWFRAVGVAEDPRAERGPSFDDDFLLIRATLAGQGLALVRDVYAAEDIASGRLALVLNQSWPTEFAYYAVTLPDATKRQPVRAFIDWLKEEARGDGEYEPGNA